MKNIQLFFKDFKNKNMEGREITKFIIFTEEGRSNNHVNTTIRSKNVKDVSQYIYAMY